MGWSAAAWHVTVFAVVTNTYWALAVENTLIGLEGSLHRPVKQARPQPTKKEEATASLKSQNVSTLVVTADGQTEHSKLIRSTSSKRGTATSEHARHRDCAEQEAIQARLAQLQALKSKAASEVEVLERYVQNSNFGGADELSRTTLARQYSEPKCLCKDEASRNSTTASRSHRHMDMTCAHLGHQSHASACQGGFPFFRMTSNALDMDMCFQFCIGMGLDIFALVDNAECRCGATAGNRGAWGSITPLKALLPPDLAAAPRWTPKCHIKAAVYLGLVDGHTPDVMLSSTDVEQKYIKSIMLQKDIRAQDDEPDLQGSKTGFMLVQSATEPQRYVNERCIPGQESCAPWALYPKTGDNAVVEVYLQTEDLEFSDGTSYALPESTQAYFREAMQRLEDLSCVRFTEVSSPGEHWDYWAWEWGLIVGKKADHQDYCYMQTTGVPGRMSYINLGWCDSEAYIGSMVHELLHALGMNHEMKRPDAWVTYEDQDGVGHGPYLSWDAGGMPTDSQLLPDENSYVGSTDAGWAEYDFDSIMHYGAWTGEWQTIPSGANDDRTGQRTHPSEGDIAQLNDYYRCPSVASTTTATEVLAHTVTPEGVEIAPSPFPAVVVKAHASRAQWSTAMTLCLVFVAAAWRA
mmetsp:Transcript_23976/g.44042  ORF Transcript_23976/g.44042 Transcript_23976/m.44042 type:complete len:635 (-) Transcript_23976:164-2068(-)